MSDYDEYDQEEKYQTGKVSVSGTVDIDTERIVNGVIKRVAESILKECREEIREEALTGLKEAVRQLFDSALDMEVTTCDRFGKPTGTQRTVRSILINDISGFLEQVVDGEGHVTHRGGQKRSERYLESSLDCYYKKQFRKDVDAAVKQISNSLVEESKKLLMGKLLENITQATRPNK